MYEPTRQQQDAVERLVVQYDLTVTPPRAHDGPIAVDCRDAGYIVRSLTLDASGRITKDSGPLTSGASVHRTGEVLSGLR